MIDSVNANRIQKKKRSEIDPIWKRIYVERAFRMVFVVFLIFSIVEGVSLYFYSHDAANIFFFLFITCGYIVGIVNYIFIERYWRRIGQRRIQALQIAKREDLPQSRKFVADEDALAVPTTLRLYWGRGYVIGVRVALVLFVLLATTGGIAIAIYPNMHGSLEVVTILAVVFGGGFALIILLYYFFTGRYQGQTIEITDEGIRTRYMRQERFMRWDEARLFASYGATGINKNLLVETYELSNEETVVRWSQQQPGLTLLSVHSDAGLKDDWNWLVEQVNAVVHAHTGLPLTDLGDNSQIPQWLAQRWTGEGRTRSGQAVASAVGTGERSVNTEGEAIQDEDS
jgi:hypothetical protein